MACRNSPPPRRGLRPLAGLLLLSLGLPGAARSAPAPVSPAPGPNYAQAAGLHGLLHWKRMPLRVCFTPGAAATPERREQACAGFDEWTRATDGVIAYRVTASPAEADVSVTIDDAPLLDEHTHEAGRTLLTFAGDAMKKADIELAAGGATPNQMQEVAAHEFGHALGIDGHSDDPNDLMSPVEHRLYDPYGTPIDAPARNVTTRDLNTLKACYGPLFAAPPQARLTARNADADSDSEAIGPDRSRD